MVVRLWSFLLERSSFSSSSSPFIFFPLFFSPSVVRLVKTCFPIILSFDSLWKFPLKTVYSCLVYKHSPQGFVIHCIVSMAAAFFVWKIILVSHLLLWSSLFSYSTPTPIPLTQQYTHLIDHAFRATFLLIQRHPKCYRCTTQEWKINISDTDQLRQGGYREGRNI